MRPAGIPRRPSCRSSRESMLRRPGSGSTRLGDGFARRSHRRWAARRDHSAVRSPDWSRRMTTKRLGVARALVDGRFVAGDVAVDGPEVVEIGLPPAAGDRIAAPGLVDAQVNGFAGVDLMSTDEDGVRQISRDVTRHGVTAWVPTLITAPAAATDRALDVLAKALAATPDPGAARPLGVHLEGPYLSPDALGTHPAEHRRDPDLGEMRGWRQRCP